MPKSLCEHMFLIFFGMQPAMKLPDHTKSVYLTNVFSKVIVSFLMPPAMYKGLVSLQHCITWYSQFFFFYYSHSSSVYAISL